jgi:hypothetical protein
MLTRGSSLVSTVSRLATTDCSVAWMLSSVTTVLSVDVMMCPYKAACCRTELSSVPYNCLPQQNMLRRSWTFHDVSGQGANPRMARLVGSSDQRQSQCPASASSRRWVPHSRRRAGSLRCSTAHRNTWAAAPLLDQPHKLELMDPAVAGSRPPDVRRRSRYPPCPILPRSPVVGRLRAAATTLNASGHRASRNCCLDGAASSSSWSSRQVLFGECVTPLLRPGLLSR